MRGTVVAFDPGRGLGEVRTPDGRVLPFHCAEIADGTRDISVGVEVGFALRLRLGGLEAARLAT